VSDEPSSIVVRDNAQSHAYEALMGGRVVGHVLYDAVREGSGTRIVIRSTVVDPQLRGVGIGAVLVEAALDSVRAKGATVTSYCSFVDDFIAANPGYADLVDSAHPGSYQAR
jgi:predicted GNAT family acetyltransferase